MAPVRVVDALTEWRARRWLGLLATRVAEGLAVAASVPGLTAAVDQHAAAVRDLLRRSGTTAPFSDRVLLAGYGRGLLDRYDVTVAQVGLEATGRWMQADWLALRLLAVCTLDRGAATR
jgi:Family of unknown function (DUF6401)